MKKYKIAIDVSPLNDGNSIRGVGYYTKSLVSSIQREILTNSQYSNFDIKLITDKSQLNSAFDLIHYPYFDPFKLTLPGQTRPYIVTCHDLIPRAFKPHFPVGIKGEIKWLIQKHRLQNSKFIICPSHYAKYQILNQINYPADRIYTTYEAATPDFKKITDTKYLKTIKNKYHLPDNFIFYVGDLNWNKNIPGLVKACLKLNYDLVIGGFAATSPAPVHPWTQDLIWVQSQTSPLIHKTGFIPDDDLPAFYNLAKIYCLPSYSEGFGLAPLQSMQCGTPVCCSNIGCLQEIVESNGLYFDPYQPDDLEKVLKQFWDNDNLRKKYSQLGLARAKFFNWQKTALQTLSVYQQLLD